MPLSTIILAAGQGTRMRSRLPKVLHELGGKPLLGHVVETAMSLDGGTIHVVYGHVGKQVRDVLSHCPVSWVEQAEQLGTGHAVAQALPGIPDQDTVLVLYGDVPLIRSETLQHLQEAAGPDTVALLTAHLEHPRGYGRILRDEQGHVVGIVEEKDASTQQRLISEINTGFLAANSGRLKHWLEGLDNSNAKGEYYLTDIIARAAADGVTIQTIAPGSEEEIHGINDRIQLADQERRYQRRQAEHFMKEGVTLIDPGRFDLRGSLEVGRDVIIDVNVVLEGDVYLGDGVALGPNTVIRNTHIEEGAMILSHCHIDGAIIGAGARVGPFARIRPETELATEAQVGNFVEIKKTKVGKGSKINHLSYVGDTTVGSKVNIGAGTITCNYDGANKHHTIIGDGAFIGSDTQLVAPVEVGAGATIGAGSTITKDAPPNELTLSRVPQTTRNGWKRPQKKK
ncbi:MAG: bifunctional UDP-N-acetylglucosamine diphosphorylase/glucosamine-1-phosphate N-acetyltransferase GlmU [Gammaproteobacteria bacterium]